MAVDLLRAQIRLRVATHAPDHVFIQAGVIERRGQILVMPGESFTGKRTLVAALAARGATPLSDDYAVLDHDGTVHPYPRRGVSALVPSGPGRIALVALTHYRPGARFAPVIQSTGEGAIALLSHAVASRSGARNSLQTVTRAVTGASALAGERGEADEAAALLLDTLDRL